MATKKATKAQKPAAKKTAKKKSRTVALRSSKREVHAGTGDNSKINYPLVEIFEEHELLDEQKKALSKQQRELKARAKSEHTIDGAVFAEQIRKRRMEVARRVQFEIGCRELDEQLGFDFALAAHSDDGDEAANEAARAAEEAANAA